MNSDEMLVDFKKYCINCKYFKVPEHWDPCNECLEYRYRKNTAEPYNFALAKNARPIVETSTP